MTTSHKTLNDGLRAQYMEKVGAFLAEQGEELLVTASNEYAIPCVDAEGNDSWLVLTFKVPTGSRDGDPYDGYSLAEDYEMKCKAKKEKAQESARKKAEKIKRDEEARKARAEAKAKAKAERGE